MFRYNMQSGEPRGSYPQSATPTAKEVKTLANVMKPGSITKITEDGYASKQIGVCVVVYGGARCEVRSGGTFGSVYYNGCVCSVCYS